MAMSYGAISSLGLLSQHYPPPLLPKPGKDNVRLQKLLKRTAKKKAAQQAQQTPVPFRSSLSPVNEASPDLERSDHSTPPKTPETPVYFGTALQPRFNVRPLYQHVASPYPHHRSFTFPTAKPSARLSPQPYTPPVQTTARPVTPRIIHTPPPRPAGLSSSPGPASYAEAHMLPGVTPPASPVTPLLSAPASTAPAAQATSLPTPKPTITTAITQGPVTIPISVTPAKTPEPTVYLTPTVLVPHKAPSPRFHVTDVTKTSKAMFDVPQITQYTAKTSYYETAKAPLHDTTGGRLSSHGRSPSPRPRSKTPTPDARRGVSPMRADGRRGPTPTLEIRGRKTPTSEVQRGRTPTAELRGRTTPVNEVKRGATPTGEMRGRATPTPENKKGTAKVLEVKRDLTPTTETKRATTPTYELTPAKTLSGRPKTPSHVVRPKTPVVEISRPNPLLFAVSPEYMEGRRSKTPTSLSVSGDNSQKPIVLAETTVILNGDVQTKPSEVKPTNEVLSQPQIQVSTPGTSTKKASVQQSVVSTPTISVTLADTPTPPPQGIAVSKPDTPKNGIVASVEGSALRAASPKPKSAQSHAQTLKPIIGQRPRTPTHGGVRGPPKTYYGLTPADYVAHGGIQTTSPSYSVSRPKTPTTEPPKPEDKLPETKIALQEAAKVEVPNDEKAVMKVPEAQPQKIVSTETKTSEQTKTEKFEKVPPSETKTKAVPVVERDKPKVSEVKQTKSPIPKTVSGALEKDTVKTETPKSLTPKTPKSEGAKTPPVPRHVAALLSKTKTSEETQDVRADKEKENLKASIVKDSVVKVESIDDIFSPKPLVSVPPTTDKSGTQSVVEPKTEIKPIADKKVETKTGDQPSVPASAEKEKDESSFPKAEPLLKVVQKPKGMKSKLSGWSRLKKHMVVEVEEPKFPESDSTGEVKKDVPNGDMPKLTVKSEATQEGTESTEETEGKDSPRATKMWDAVLFQMFSTKENIMKQIMADKSEEEKKEIEAKGPEKNQEIPSFAHRLPVLLFSPRFDAKRLREAASRPVTKMSTVFEMGLIGRKTKDDEPKQFNRTARGFNTSKSSEA